MRLRQIVLVISITALIGSSFPASVLADELVFRHVVDRARIDIDLPIGEHTFWWGPCEDDESERWTVEARQARYARSGNVVRRGIYLSIDCVWYEDGQANAYGGGLLYDAAKLKRFEVDPQSKAVYIKFAETRGYHPWALKRFPRWELTLYPTDPIDRLPRNPRNRCGAVTLRDHEYSYGARAEGMLFGRDVTDGTTQVGEIDRWTSTGVCI